MKLNAIKNYWDASFYHRLYIVLGTILICTLLGCGGYLFAVHYVVLDVDGQKLACKTLSGTVAQVLREQRVTLEPGDRVYPDLQTRLSGDVAIEVVRAFPVTIKIDGKTIEFHTTTTTVGNVLKDAGISIQQTDLIKPGPNMIVKPAQLIRVTRVTSTIVTRQVSINPPTEYRKDKTLDRGAELVVREGRSGLVERQIKVVYEDGREIKRYTIGERIIRPAVTGIIALGIKPILRTLVTSRGSYRYLEMKVMDATGYYPGPESCGKYAVYGETYTGKKAGFGIVAVDPRVIPLGTKLYIDGYGKAEAADIGSAIKRNRIDLCFETYREAELFGRKNVKVYILAE